MGICGPGGSGGPWGSVGPAAALGFGPERDGSILLCHVFWVCRLGQEFGPERGVPAPLLPSASRGGSDSRAPNQLLPSGEMCPSGCSPRFPIPALLPCVAPSIPVSSVGSTAHPGPGAACTRIPILPWGNPREWCLKNSLSLFPLLNLSLCFPKGAESWLDGGGSGDGDSDSVTLKNSIWSGGGLWGGMM